MDQSNIYDKILKENIELMIEPLLRRLLGRADIHYVRLPEKLQTTTEREADLLLHMQPKSDSHYILHIEWQVDIKKNMVYRIGEYHGIIQRKYKLPIRHFVIYLGRKKIRSTTRLPPSEVYQGYELIRLHEWDAISLLQAKQPGEIIMALLGNYPEEQTTTIIDQAISRLIEVSSSLQELKRYTQQLLVLARLRNLTPQVTKHIETMPITYDIKSDYLFNKGKAEGIEQGIEQGRLQGVQLQNVAFVKRLSELKMDTPTIAAYTGLTLEEVEKILSDLRSQQP